VGGENLPFEERGPGEFGGILSPRLGLAVSSLILMEHSCRVIRRMIAAVSYKVHTVLTDNGTHFTTPGDTSSAAPDIKAALDAGELVWAHAFEYACAQNDIDHRLTKPRQPWTNGQVERMNRTIKDATVKRYF
jgi:transposase InsO family protein